MRPELVDTELFGVTEHDVSLVVCAAAASGVTGVDLAQRGVRLVADGEVIPTEVAGGAASPTLHLRGRGLPAATTVGLEVEIDGERHALADGPSWHGTVTTLATPSAPQTASLATFNDCHFGEAYFGGLQVGGELVAPDPAEVVRADDGPEPYWSFMHHDARDAVNRLGVDAVMVKGDVTDRGKPEQFVAARDWMAGFAAPVHAFCGNHDLYPIADGADPAAYDAYAELGQPAAPRVVTVGGWDLVCNDTVDPGRSAGVFGPERAAWLDATLAESAATGRPALVLQHQQPVPPGRDGGPLAAIGIPPADTERLWGVLARYPHVRAVLIGHTHRNRVHFTEQVPGVPFAEVCTTKDYPGAWGHYRLFADGTFRQEVRRVTSPRALDHATRCRDRFAGMYRRFALGRLTDRSYIVGA